MQLDQIALKVLQLYYGVAMLYPSATLLGTLFICLVMISIAGKRK